MTWIRYRKSKNFLKIRAATEADTGVYACKAVNGFGSDGARIELVVVGKAFGYYFKCLFEFNWDSLELILPRKPMNL